MVARVTVRDMGWRKIRGAVKQLDGKGVKVGILARDAGKQNDGVAVIDYAMFNEFGTERIPKRPFMRRTADRSIGPLKAITSKWAGLIVTGRMSVDQVLPALGMWYQMRIQGMIRSARSWAVPNAPSTIKRKGSSSPLIDDGVMINTIGWEKDG